MDARGIKKTVEGVREYIVYLRKVKAWYNISKGTKLARQTLEELDNVDIPTKLTIYDKIENELAKHDYGDFKKYIINSRTKFNVKNKEDVAKLMTFIAALKQIEREVYETGIMVAHREISNAGGLHI